MTKQDVRARIEEYGILPAIRVSSPADVLFAADALSASGLPIMEVTMTVPGAIQVVAELVRTKPGLIVGAGSILDTRTALRCIDAGASFLTSTGFEAALVELAIKQGILVFPGALTPTEVITAWKAGSDFVKVYPCAQMGGASYIRALKSPLPQVSLIAAGGVNQQTASDFILAGASALGIGKELIPHEAIRRRQSDWIEELAHRFLSIVKKARSRNHSPT